MPLAVRLRILAPFPTMFLLDPGSFFSELFVNVGLGLNRTTDSSERPNREVTPYRGLITTSHPALLRAG
jgi:hypothetical protein